jgi:NAD-dependent deacetylase
MMIDLQAYKRIVVLTGAGVSVASGLRTYRGPGGLWKDEEVRRAAMAATLWTEPALTWQLFGARRMPARTAQPNAAHQALVRMEESMRADQQFLLITQNVDGLHQRAGSKKVLELHGNVTFTRCTNNSCELPRFEDGADHSDEVPRCPKCGSVLRPDVVMFGEYLPSDTLRQSTQALRVCDLFIAIGTSGVVSPASQFVELAEVAGARTIYVNLEPMEPRNPAFHEEYLGRAEELLPSLCGGGAA